MLTPSRTRAELYLLSLTVIWGSTFVFTKFILLDASPFVYIALRFAVASIIFVLFFFRRLINISKPAIIKGTILGIFLFSGFVLQTVGLKYTSASKSAFITGLMVVFTPLFQLLIERKKPKLGSIIGVILVAAGLFFLTSPEGSEFNVGDFLTLICAVLYSIYTVYLTIYGQKYDPSHLTFMQFISTTLLSVFFVLIWENTFLNINTNFILLIGYLAIMPTVVALYFMAKYQKYTTPTRSAVIYSLEPPFAAIFAYLLIGEQIGTLGIMGGILIFMGLIMSELSDVVFRQKSSA